MPVIVIASPKGGAGKSTTAVLLGTELAHVASHRRMGADVEIRQRRRPRAASAPIGEPGFARQKARLPGQVFTLEQGRGQKPVEILDTAEGDGDLSIDQGVDKELPPSGDPFQSLGRPLAPSRVIRRDVDQDVRIDQNTRHPSVLVRATGQRHDALGRHPGVGLAAQAGDGGGQRRIVALFPPAQDTHHPIVVDGELKLGAGQEARPFPDRLRDRDLAFAGDAHGVLLYYFKCNTGRRG